MGEGVLSKSGSGNEAEAIEGEENILPALHYAPDSTPYKNVQQ